MIGPGQRALGTISRIKDPNRNRMKSPLPTKKGLPLINQGRGPARNQTIMGVRKNNGIGSRNGFKNELNNTINPIEAVGMNLNKNRNQFSTISPGQKPNRGNFMSPPKVPGIYWEPDKVPTRKPGLPKNPMPPKLKPIKYTSAVINRGITRRKFPGTTKKN